MQNNKSNIKKQKFLLFTLIGAFLILCFLLTIPLTSASTTYVYGPGGLVASVDDYDGDGDDDVYYYVGDGGSTYKVVDESGNFIYHAKFSPFGEFIKVVGQSPVDVVDKDTGLIGHFDPDTARVLQGLMESIGVAWDTSSQIESLLEPTPATYTTKSLAMARNFAEFQLGNVKAVISGNFGNAPSVRLLKDIWGDPLNYVPIYHNIHKAGKTDDVLLKIGHWSMAVHQTAMIPLMYLVGTGKDVTLWGGKGAVPVGTTAIVKYDPEFAAWQSPETRNYIYGLSSKELTIISNKEFFAMRRIIRDFAGRPMGKTIPYGVGTKIAAAVPKDSVYSRVHLLETPLRVDRYTKLKYFHTHIKLKGRGLSQYGIIRPGEFVTKAGRLMSRAEAEKSLALTYNPEYRLRFTIPAGTRVKGIGWGKTVGGGEELIILDELMLPLETVEVIWLPPPLLP